jgi:dGTPase
MLKTYQDLLKEEEARLAPYAVRSSNSGGRVHKEKSDDYRLPFQRDRDRVMHSKAFRRLQAKAQVFVAYFGDHYRDRLTHSLEVAQIARDICRRLGLNEDLAECISLAHDIGHPPFGHGGEQALNEVLKERGFHYEHNEQGIRVLTELESPYPGFNGLNLTKEVLDGLLKHEPGKVLPHLEAQMVDNADQIAYVNHDIDDALRAGIIKESQLAHMALWRETQERVAQEYGAQLLHNERFIRRINSKMIGAMINDLQEETEMRLVKNNIRSVEDVYICKKPLVGFSGPMEEKIKELKDFLMEYFYFNPKVADKINRGKKILKSLFLYYLDNLQELPGDLQARISGGEAGEIIVKDYIAGMTDHFAEENYKSLNLKSK